MKFYQSPSSDCCISLWTEVSRKTQFYSSIKSETDTGSNWLGFVSVSRKKNQDLIVSKSNLTLEAREIMKRRDSRQDCKQDHPLSRCPWPLSASAKHFQCGISSGDQSLHRGQIMACAKNSVAGHLARKWTCGGTKVFLELKTEQWAVCFLELNSCLYGHKNSFIIWTANCSTLTF